MKKNKTTQYLLFALVLVIWGAVAFQFLQFQQDASVSNNLEPALPFQALTDSSFLENYSLKVNYKDPFLGKLNKRPSSEAMDNKTTSAPAPKSNNPAHIATNPKKPHTPDIQYKGYSLNNRQIQRVSLSVNGKLKSYKPGERDGELTLLDMQKDSVIISWAGVRRVVFRR